VERSAATAVALGGVKLALDMFDDAAHARGQVVAIIRDRNQLITRAQKGITDELGLQRVAH